MAIKSIRFGFVLWLTLFTFNAHAGIVLGGTRLIFNGNKSDAAIEVNNPDPKNFLIQSWVSLLDDKKAENFIVTPPLFRIDANSSNVIRIILTKDTLPQDRESLFWLNVKAIPSSDPNAKDILLIAVNTKIKLFYRPKDLINKEANNAYQKLTFKIDQNNKELIASNPTAYYINFSEVTFNGKKIENPGVVPPFGHTSWKVKLSPSNNNVNWNIINDFGGISATLSKTID